MRGEERRLTAGELRGLLDDFHDEAPVVVRFEGSLPMPVESAETLRRRNGEFELALVLPAQPTEDSAVDSDFTRLCEKMIRGESTIFQVRFGMDLMRQCNARTPAQRLDALSKYFAEAKRRIDEQIRFGEETGRMAAEAAGDDDDEAPDRRRRTER